MTTDPSAPSSARIFIVLVWLRVYRNVSTPAATRINPINESWSNSIAIPPSRSNADDSSPRARATRIARRPYPHTVIRSVDGVPHARRDRPEGQRPLPWHDDVRGVGQHRR